MDIQHSQYTVADYCAMYDRHEVTVNKSYQRSDKVWPRPAQTFLVETILMGFPIPKLSLHVKTDVRTRTSVRDVVDGQQRTKAIIDFYHDRYKLGRNLEEVPEAAGKAFSDLEPELQANFLSYGLNFDIFVQATDEEVREVFRRMNSFTVPLNAEEQRHATFQGPFKWFVNSLVADYGNVFLISGLFSANQLVRMQDTKLITEIATAYFNGITTTKPVDLNRTYRARNKGDAFEGEADLDRRLRAALDLTYSWTDLYGSTLMKRPYLMYSLILAVMHLQESVEKLTPYYDATDVNIADTDTVLVNLSRLSDAVKDDAPDEVLLQFVNASSDKTNVGGQREIRFRTFCDALSDQLP